MSNQTYINTTHHNLRQKPPKIFRSHPICWLNSAVQFLNYIKWPKEFFNYIDPALQVSQYNIIGQSFNILRELRNTNIQKISSNFMNNIANKSIIPHINNYQLENISATAAQDRIIWSIYVEQDASEFIRYFFMMLCDINNIENTSESYIITDQTTPLIKKMKTYIINNFTFTTSVLKVCLNSQSKTEIQIETQQTIQFSLDPYGSDDVSIQHLFNKYCQISTVEEVKCELCNTNHTNKHQTIFKSFKNCKYLCVTIRRWSPDNTKQTNIITGLGKPIIIPSSDGLVVFFTRGVLNHIGADIDIGHYNTDVFCKKKLYNCDDKFINDRTTFNGLYAYNLILEKAPKKLTHKCIAKYKSLIRNLIPNANTYKNIPYKDINSTIKQVCEFNYTYILNILYIHLS